MVRPLLVLALLCCGCSSSGCTKLTPPSSQTFSINAQPAVMVVGGVPVLKNRNAKLGYPTSDLPEILISRDQYLISWNKERRTLNWSAWQLTANDLGSSGRSNDFEQDPDLAKVVPNAVQPTDYQGTCLDRGHTTPSGDRTDTADHNLNTFLMSNMMPQAAHLNRVNWEHLEEYERKLVNDGQTIFIFAGAIYGSNPSKIGPHQDIAVPDKNFKIITDADGKVLTSVIMPNVTSTGTDPIKDHTQECNDAHSEMVRRLKKESFLKEEEAFAASIKDIEQQSGLNFDFIHP